jgi:uncharacterized membrane protein
MELVAKRTFIMLALVAAISVGGLSLGSAAYAGEDDGGDTSTTAPRSSSDSGGSPSGGVNTGGGGTAGSDASTLPIALGGLGALAGGSLLLRRFAREDG